MFILLIFLYYYIKLILKTLINLIIQLFYWQNMNMTPPTDFKKFKNSAKTENDKRKRIRKKKRKTGRNIKMISKKVQKKQNNSAISVSSKMLEDINKINEKNCDNMKETLKLNDTPLTDSRRNIDNKQDHPTPVNKPRNKPNKPKKSNSISSVENNKIKSSLTDKKEQLKNKTMNETNKAKVNTKKVIEQPPSLKNIGANCYLNSAIQGISSCNTFVKDISDICTLYKDSGLELLPVFKELIDILNGSSSDKMEISRNAIFCNWNKTGHQDSYELLAHVINQVYNEIRQYKEKVGEIGRRDLQAWLKEKMPMRFLMRYEIECGCQKVTYSPMQSDLALHLSIPLGNKSCRLDNLIDLYFAKDYIEDYTCDKPGCSGALTYRFIQLSEPLPNTVCIHLQRTTWNGNEMKKIEKEIQFDLFIKLKEKYWSKNKDGQTKDIENKKRKQTGKFGANYPKIPKGIDLNIDEKISSDEEMNYASEDVALDEKSKSDRLCLKATRNRATTHRSMSSRSGNRSTDMVYHLTSVIVHYGTVTCGHYVCYKRFGDKWFLTNDSMIEEVGVQDVLNCQAYILFYERP